MKDFFYCIRTVILHPIHKIKNYRRDNLIEKMHKKSIAKGEEPDDID